jgi:hypothetical protein
MECFCLFSKLKFLKNVRGVTTLSRTTLNIIKLSMLIVTISITIVFPPSNVMLNVLMLCDVSLSVMMLNLIMLCVALQNLNVMKLSVAHLSLKLPNCGLVYLFALEGLECLGQYRAFAGYRDQ